LIKNINLLFLGLLLLFSSKSIFATHVAGSEMTYITTITQPGGVGTAYQLTFDFTLKVYRDCDGVGLATTQTVWYDFGFIDSTASPILGNPNYVCNSCAFLGGIGSFTVTRSDPPTTIDLICSSQTANCDGGGVDGFEEHIYKGTVTISLSDLEDPSVFGLQPGKVLRFYFNDYARNNAINNVTSPGTKSLYNQVTYNVRKAIKNFDDVVLAGGSSTINGSPVVTQKPVFYGCVNEEINFSNIAIDDEGHNIRYFLVNPLYIDNPPPSPPLSTIPYLPLNIPFSGSYNYLDPWDVTGAGFNLNPSIGQLSFTPTNIGNFIFSIVLLEIDTNGGVLGTTMRDYQFVIENCSNPITPNVSGPDFDTTTYTYRACYNQPFCFDVLGIGTGTIANELRYNNEIDTSLSPLNSFTILSQNTDSTVARFCWDPGTFNGVTTFTITSELDVCPYKQFGTFTYTIIIDTNYNAICQDSVVYLDSNGLYVIDSTYVWDTSVTNTCDIFTIDIDRDTFLCADIGNQTVNVTTTFVNGIVRYCTSNITVLDTISPTIICLPATLYLDATGSLVIDTTGLISSLSDNCSVDSVWINVSDTLFGCIDTGLNTVTIYVQDPSGNIDSCVSTITVLDTISPTITCLPATLYLDATGTLVIDTTGLIASIGDNCSLDSVWVSVSDILFGCTDTGLNTVTIYVQDPSGNIDSCVSTITVLDTISPTISCLPATLYLDATGVLIIDTTALISSTGDNCSLDSVWVNVNDTLLNCVDTGIYMATIYVMDASGNIDSCISTLTILDTISPTISCLPATFYLPASGQIIIDTTGLISSTGDNCSLDSVWVNVNDTLLNCVDTGIYMATIYVQDPSGNIDSCVSTITVLDTISPTITCLPATLYLDATGLLIVDTTGLISSTGDNCSVDSVWVNVNDTLLNCVDTGIYMATIYVMDASGNIDSCVSTLTILDTISPTISCLPATFYLPASGQIIIDTTGLISSTGDNCSVDSVWVNVNDTLFNCVDTGIYTATIYVMDASGNIDSCISTLTILDTISPTISCLPATFYLPASGQIIIDTTGLISSTGDNCSVDSVWVNVNDTLLNCVDTGIYMATIYVMDASGNIDSCISTLTILDTISPTISCLPATFYLPASGQIIIDTTGLISSTGDNCSVDSVWVNVNDTLFSCVDTGIYMATIYVMDPSGNIDSCVSTLTILDTISPTISCLPATLYLDATGLLIIDTTGLISSTGDNCSVDSVWLNSNDTSYNCTDTGIYMATIYVMDASGNIDSCISAMMILDTINPLVICRDTTIYLDVAGNYTVDSSYINNGSNDACGIQTITLDRYAFYCTDTGVNSITMYVTDVNGNIDSCMANVTVIDTIGPVAVCMDTAVYLDITGSITIDSSFIDGGSSDPCGVFVLNQSVFNCTHIGPNNVTLYVYDLNNNLDSCVAIVTVLDTIKPTVICKDTTLYLDSTGNFVIDSSYINNGSNDACGIANITINTTIYSCVDTGINTITLYVTDNNGNIDSCTANITIRDTIIPIVSAGLNDSLCGVYNYNLNGNIPAGTLTGTWRIFNGPNVPVYSNVNTPNANVSGLIEGTYEFIWSISNGIGCNITEDTMSLYIYDVPVSNAGIDTGLCNQFSLGLYANTPSGLSSGTWSYVIPSPTIPVFTNANNPTTVVSNLDEGTYTLVWTTTNGNCIDATDTMLLSVYETPVSNAGTDQSQCGTQSTILLANSPAGTASGTWTNVNGPNMPTILTPTSPLSSISNLIEGTYTFVWTVSNGVCTSASDTMLLYVYDSVISNAGADTNLCNIYNLNLYGNQPTGTASGQWYINPTTIPPSVPVFTDSSQYNTNVSGLVEGTYNFLWITQNGNCPFAVDTVIINVWDNPSSNAGIDSSLCAIFNIDMFADSIGGTSQGTWSLDLSVGNPNIPNIVNPNQYNTSVTGLIEGEYTFVWHVTNGPCYDYYDTVLITIYDQPTAIAGPDQFLCDLPSTNINAVPLTGSSVGTWYLANGTPNTPTFNPNTSSTSVSGMQEAGTYTLYYEAVNGVCPISRDTIVINNYPIPVVDFTQSAIEICQEECIQFTNLSSIHPDGTITNYYWVVGGMYSTQTNPNYCFSNAGLMDVQLVAESNNSCRDTVFRNNLIKVNNIPVAGFYTFLVDDPNSSTKIQIQDNSVYSTNYWYSLGDGDTTTTQNPTHIYTDSGFYDITQIVTNDFGCADTLTKTIFVHVLLVYVPNTFTPDGNGHNEKFFPVVSGDDPDSYLLRIFNRWGELIFQSQNKNEKWDGTFKGEDCKTDTYVWILRTKYKDGDRHFDYRGHVNLLR
jgi:gliding motility-associated-like protein